MILTPFVMSCQVFIRSQSYCPQKHSLHEEFQLFEALCTGALRIEYTSFNDIQRAYKILGEYFYSVCFPVSIWHGHLAMQ